MAMPFLDFRPLKKSKAKPAVKEVEHLLRQGAYASRTDLLWSTTFRLPVWAAQNPAVFFQASETYEREGGTWAFVLWCSVPRGLTLAATIALGEEFVATMFPAYAGLAVLHEPLAADGHPQPHFHMLFSARLLDSHDRPAAQFFSRYNAAHPACGGARKDALVTARHYASLLHTTWDTLRIKALTRDPAPSAGVPLVIEPPPEVTTEALTMAQKFSQRARMKSQAQHHIAS